jgi:hypothetical protein
MLEVDGNDDAALPSTESCQWPWVIVRGSFCGIFLWFWFIHSTGILCRIGTKHQISVQKFCENLLEQNLSIVVSIAKFGCIWVSLGDPKNQIWLFEWIRVSSGDLNLAIIAKNWIQRAVYQWRIKSGLMGNFLSPILGIPEFLRSVPTLCLWVLGSSKLKERNQLVEVLCKFHQKSNFLKLQNTTLHSLLSFSNPKDAKRDTCEHVQNRSVCFLQFLHLLASLDVCWCHLSMLAFGLHARNLQAVIWSSQLD